jgi:hypothetical protein
LGAKLNFIAIVDLGFSKLEFDGNDGRSVRCLDKLHHVGLTCQSELEGSKPEGAHSAALPSALELLFVHFFMQKTPLGGTGIFRPGPFYVNQCPLTLAKGEMLKCRDREEFVLCEHGSGVHWYRRHCL